MTRLREHVTTLEDRLTELEQQRAVSHQLATAVGKRALSARKQLAELQSRELEKGAHLLWDNLDRNVEDGFIDVEGQQLERITKADSRRYGRLLGEDDPLLRGGQVTHATADLLPIQRLARYDDNLLAEMTSTQNDELAAKVWRERDQAGRYDLWSKGGGEVDVYLDASDVADWIRRQRSGVSKQYSQELARRVMDAMRELANGRLAEMKKSHRKDGLQYTERRLVLKTEVDLPGTVSSGTGSPTTDAGVGTEGGQTE